MVGEIGQRIAERRELPIEHGGDFRRIGRDNHIVEPVIAVHEARRFTRRQMRRQPGDQPLHVLDACGFRRAILFRPALHLPRHVILAAAVIAKSDLDRIEVVQLRQRRVHGVINACAFGSS